MMLPGEVIILFIVRSTAPIAGHSEALEFLTSKWSQTLLSCFEISAFSHHVSVGSFLLWALSFALRSMPLACLPVGRRYASGQGQLFYGWRHILEMSRFKTWHRGFHIDFKSRRGNMFAFT
jgi:hypothetical protein